jgi:hypothetical protein
VLQTPNVLKARGIVETLQVLRDVFAEEDVRAMVKQNPGVLRTPAATAERHLKKLRAELSDTAAVREAVSRNPEVLRANVPLERALRR